MIACGSGGRHAAPTPAVAPAPAPKTAAPSPDEAAERERDEHEAIVEAHRKIEDQQQEALAATCDAPAPTHDHERCLPSCYPTESPDARAGKKLAGKVEVDHLVCERGDGSLVQADELVPKLRAAVFPRRFPQAHKPTTWQGKLEAALHDKLPRGDILVVAGGWRAREHPLTHEKLRCVTVAHYAQSLHHPLDTCGGIGEVACEAGGNAAARAINVVRYRLDEAKRLQTQGKTADCQQAALEAIAVARGLPRWRQYVKLNIRKWTDNLSYRTRFDGILDEDTLFQATAAMGSEAEGVYAACGGTGATTTPEQEQSFHTCW